jgi:hypothetical protein
VGEQPGYRRHEDHAAVPLSDHEPPDGLAEPIRRRQVQGDGVFPVAVFQVEHRLAHVAPDRVQKDVRRSHHGDGLAHGLATGLRRPQVGGQRLDLVASLLSGAHYRVQVLLVHVDERDARTLGGQAQRAGCAEPTGSEDQGRPTAEREPVLHGVYPSRQSSRTMKVAFWIP